MFQRIRQRLDMSVEQGFTLIELIVVIVILGILLAIAVPSYLGFRDRAANSAAKSNLRSALPSAEAYYADNGTYVGLTVTALKAINPGLAANVTVAGTPSATSYCLTDTESGKTWSMKGPGATYYTTNNCT